MDPEKGTNRPRFYRSPIVERAVLAMFAVLFLYDSYRYPFRINSTGTSPTYTNTPPLLSAGKYVLVLGVILYIVVRLKRTRLGLWPEGSAWRFAYLYLFLIPVVYGMLTRSAALVESGFFFLIPLALHFAGRRCVKAEFLSRILKWAVLAAAGVDFVQVVARIAWGRLPALAFPGPFVLSRFGSFLDDPNGFGILLALFMGYSIFAFKGKGRLLVLMALVACLVLTESFTAYAVVPASAICLWFITGSARTRFRIALCIAIALLGAVWVWVRVPAVSQAYELLVMSKQGSVSGHMGEITAQMNHISLLSLAGLVPRTWMIESGYANILLSCGVVYLTAYLGVFAVCLRKCAWFVASGELSSEARAVAAGAFCFLVAVLLGTANLPFEHIFPVDGLVTLFMALISTRLIFEFRTAERGLRNLSSVHASEHHRPFVARQWEGTP